MKSFLYQVVNKLNFEQYFYLMACSRKYAQLRAENPL